MTSATRRWLTALLLGCCGCGTGACTMVPDDERPLIELARSADSTASTASPDVRSDLKIFDDGRVELDPRFSADDAASPVRRRLASDALAELRQRILVELDAWSIDTAEIERAIEEALDTANAATSESITVLGADAVADAATTIIRIDDGTRRRELRFYNLVGASARHPGIDSLQRLRAIEVYLLELAQRLGAK